MNPRAVAVAALLLGAPQALVAQRTSYEELQTFSSVLAHVRANYVDSVSQAELVRAAIAGTLDALDPHSHYLRRTTLDRLSAVEAGLLGTVGVRLEPMQGGVRILSVGPRSPGDRAGLRAGDRLVAVNDTPVAGLGDRDAEALLAGPAGSRVRLDLLRGPPAAEQPVRAEPRRAVYAWPAVTTSLLIGDSTGYVALGAFQEGSARELDRALEALRRGGARRLILDLRGNPGGIIDEAVRVAALLLPDGTEVASVVGRQGVQHTYRTRGGGDTRTPLVVLIDAHSASAAEALAGALQDHDRARIGGRRSFGKALAQVHFPLPSGDQLVLTIGRLTTPRGRSLQREYRGLTHAQYYAMAGSAARGSTPDSVRTATGRLLPPGPGVAPDAPLEAPGELPAWWPQVLEAGTDAAVAESAAEGATASFAQWQADPAAWERMLLPPLIERAAALLGSRPEPGPAVRARIARELAARVALVRWGEAMANAFRVSTDLDVLAALTLF